MRRSSILRLAALAALVSACQGTPHRAADSVRTRLDDAESTQPVRLTVDERSAPDILRCLADSAGVVPRFTDNEPFVAADPQQPNHLLAIWQTQSGRGSVVQFTRSTDGGSTWTPPRAIPINACAGGPVATARRSSDPWVSFGPDGRAYLSALAWTPDPDDGPDEVSALVVVATPDGGLTLERPVAAAAAPSRTVAHDNLAVTADPTRPGTVYAATTRAERPAPGEYYGQLGFTRSDDGGRSWLPLRAISPRVNRERIGAPQILVDPRMGRLYAVYHRRRQQRAVVGIMISDDRGDSWSREYVVAEHDRVARVRHPETGSDFVLADDIVQAAVSPATGELFIAFADARGDSAGLPAVSVVHSRDGVAWSDPVDVSRAAPLAAWLPAIAITRDGSIAVSYYVADFTSPPNSARMRVHVRPLRYEDQTLTPLAPVTLTEAPIAWPGDYQGLTAVDRGVLAVFGRAHDIFAMRVSLDSLAR